MHRQPFVVKLNVACVPEYVRHYRYMPSYAVLQVFSIEANLEQPLTRLLQSHGTGLFSASSALPPAAEAAALSPSLSI